MDIHLENNLRTTQHYLAQRDMTQQDSVITDTFNKEKAKLRNFIRKSVPNAGDADDILQDVFYEFVSAYRLPEPLEQVGAWLYRVAKNRIVDRFRKQKHEVVLTQDDDEDALWLEAILSIETETPASIFERKMLVEHVIATLNLLPAEQRQVFIAHELDGKSFKQIAAESGVAINTLLARKRYAVTFLQEQLHAYN
ncbi:sigma-70 family RNA polymerase sigma factor [Methylophilus sp.]|uniref:RNA polymerase sigma factor n=1 Tax=Methylophilus sp. TaxID=29541 RepID=UPI0011D55A82|nr:sigma-70 family RNA polymerase sigma factor [Methylophilus sp.]TXI46486.1 MAG: sigma-70 family RNA polymerase sigma factor [Methylophilus sp.]